MKGTRGMVYCNFLIPADEYEESEEEEEAVP